MKKEKKSFIKFLIILAISTILGGVVGWGSSYIDQDVYRLGDQIQNVFYHWIPVVYLTVIIVLSVIILVLYGMRKKQYKQVIQSDDDTAIDRLEEKLNMPIIMSSAMVIINMFLFSCVMASYEMISDKYSIWMMIGILVVGYIVAIVVQRGIVEMEKELNPEKQGSIFDMNFQKEWHDSCDEREQLLIYKSCYAAYKYTNTACIVLWLLTFIGATTFHTGILPVFIVCVIWLTSMVGYSVTAMKLEKIKHS